VVVVITATAARLPVHARLALPALVGAWPRSRATGATRRAAILGASAVVLRARGGGAWRCTHGVVVGSGTTTALCPSRRPAIGATALLVTTRAAAALGAPTTARRRFGTSSTLGATLPAPCRRAALVLVVAVAGGIDVVVNNAGYAILGPFEAASSEQVRQQFETNVIGLMEVTKAVLPHFREKRSGIIINISSVGGKMAFPLYSLYNSTKWCVEGFSEGLQFELEQFNVRVEDY